jgi:hypothetical protein
MDDYQLKLHCECGWKGTRVGQEAIKHWVEPWLFNAPIGPEAKESHPK